MPFEIAAAAAVVVVATAVAAIVVIVEVEYFVVACCPLFGCLEGPQKDDSSDVLQDGSQEGVMNIEQLKINYPEEGW